MFLFSDLALKFFKFVEKMFKPKIMLYKECTDGVNFLSDNTLTNLNIQVLASTNKHLFGENCEYFGSLFINPDPDVRRELQKHLISIESVSQCLYRLFTHKLLNCHALDTGSLKQLESSSTKTINVLERRVFETLKQSIHLLDSLKSINSFCRLVSECCKL